MAGSAKRYASVLREAAGPGNGARVLQELDALAEVFLREPSLRRILENPGVSLDDKRALLTSLQDKAGVLPVVVRFLILLTERRRVALLPEIATAYRALLDAEAGLLRARLTTARTLSGSEVSRLSGRLAAALKRPVALETAVREDLLAGAQLQVGSILFDGSVSGALKALKSSLVKGSP